MNKKQAIATEIPSLRRYALALTGNQVDADELVQDCLERALNNIDKWREGDNPRKWLFTILHNLFIDGKRGLARRPMEVVLEKADEANANPDDATRKNTNNIALKKALASLSPEHREVILLVGLEGFSYREASDALDIRIGTLMSRLSRGRERLKALMGEEQIKVKPTMIRRIKCQIFPFREMIFTSIWMVKCRQRIGFHSKTGCKNTLI